MPGVSLSIVFNMILFRIFLLQFSYGDDALGTMCYFLYFNDRLSHRAGNNNKNMTSTRVIFSHDDTRKSKRLWVFSFLSLGLRPVRVHQSVWTCFRHTNNIMYRRPPPLTSPQHNIWPSALQITRLGPHVYKSVFIYMYIGVTCNSYNW